MMVTSTLATLSQQSRSVLNAERASPFLNARRETRRLKKENLQSSCIYELSRTQHIPGRTLLARPLLRWVRLLHPHSARKPRLKMTHDGNKTECVSLSNRLLSTSPRQCRHSDHRTPIPGWRAVAGDWGGSTGCKYTGTD